MNDRKSAEAVRTALLNPGGRDMVTRLMAKTPQQKPIQKALATSLRVTLGSGAMRGLFTEEQ
jgi:hypothetical protein